MKGQSGGVVVEIGAVVKDGCRCCGKECGCMVLWYRMWGGAVVKDDCCFFFCRKDDVESRMGVV